MILDDDNLEHLARAIHESARTRLDNYGMYTPPWAACDTAFRRRALNMASEIVSALDIEALVPTSYALVPRQADETMVKAGNDVLSACEDVRGVSVEEIWQAMVNAAP